MALVLLWPRASLRLSRARQVVSTAAGATPRAVLGERSNTFVDRGYGYGSDYLLRLPASAGTNPMITSGKQRLTVIGNLV